jgi:hypothetical protein
MVGQAVPNYQLKLRRAKEHLDFIAGEGTAYIERNIDRTIPFEPQPLNQWTIARWGEVESLSPMWGTYMGDVIHNLRSALDNFICALVLLNNPDHSIEHTQFPICDGERQWINDIEQRDRARGPAPTEGLSVPLLAAIKGLQPYHLKGAAKKHSPLRKLHIASNADKHRTVHTSSPCIGAKKAQIWIDPKGYFKIARAKAAPRGTAIEEGAEIGRMKLIRLRPPPYPEVRMKIKASLEVAFSVEGKPLLTTHDDLWAMLKEVGRVMLRLEKVAGIRA